MYLTTKAIFSLGALIAGSAVLAECNPTLPRAALITCLMAEQQSQTGFLPHQSQFSNQNLQFQAPMPVYQQQPIYQQPQPSYQQQTPFYQQQPVYQFQPVLPPNNQSSYR